MEILFEMTGMCFRLRYVIFLTYRSSLFKYSSASPLSVFCFIRFGSHSAKTENQSNQLKWERSR